MKVYIARSYDGAGVSDILGVFLSTEAAERAKVERGDFHQYNALTVDHEGDDTEEHVLAWEKRRIAQDWAEAAISEHEVMYADKFADAVAKPVSKWAGYEALP